MSAFYLTSFVGNVQKVYENKRDVNETLLKQLHRWWHNYQMQLQVSFEMVSLVGGVGGAECCWEVLGAARCHCYEWYIDAERVYWTCRRLGCNKVAPKVELSRWTEWKCAHNLSTLQWTSIFTHQANEYDCSFQPHFKLKNCAPSKYTCEQHICVYIHTYFILYLLYSRAPSQKLFLKMLCANELASRFISFFFFCPLFVRLQWKIVFVSAVGAKWP